MMPKPSRLRFGLLVALLLLGSLHLVGLPAAPPVGAQTPQQPPAADGETAADPDAQPARPEAATGGEVQADEAQATEGPGDGTGEAQAGGKQQAAQADEQPTDEQVQEAVPAQTDEQQATGQPAAAGAAGAEPPPTDEAPAMGEQPTDEQQAAQADEQPTDEQVQEAAPAQTDEQPTTGQQAAQAQASEQPADEQQAAGQPTAAGEPPPGAAATELPASMPPQAPQQPAAAQRPAPPQPRTPPGEPLDWTEGFRDWTRVGGYVHSNAHGGRLLVTYVTPAEAARIYEANADHVRLHEFERTRPYPDGTRIATESWVPDAAGAPGRPGPLAFMRKEGPDGPWRFVLAQGDRRVIVAGTGRGDRADFCAECHAKAADRDHVFATRR